MPWIQGYATLNVNEWLKYFNVRSNPIDLAAGNSYIIKIKPTQHVSSHRIKGIAPERRKCRFKYEKEKPIELTITEENFLLFN